MFKDSVAYLFWFVVLAIAFGLAVGCGQVDPRGLAELDAAGGAAGKGGDGGAAGGGGGELVHAGAGGAAGAELGGAGRPELGGAGGAAGGTMGHVDAAADAPAPPPICVEAAAAGFALNGTCEGGSPASRGCHAACTLNGAPFVGCVTGTPWASACYASCGACGAL